MKARRAVGLGVVGGGLLLGTAACSSSGSSGPSVNIVATQTTCELGQSQLAAGRHQFTLQNKGTEVTEVYIYAAGDKVVTEKEHVGPGTSASFNANLQAGTYDVACKPGEKGSGIRAKLTVT